VLLLLALRDALLLKLALENTSGVSPNTGVSKKLEPPVLDGLPAGLVALLLLLLLPSVPFPHTAAGGKGAGTAAVGPLPLLLLLLPLLTTGMEGPVTTFPG
jgi:hypothetical protein